MQKPVIFIIEIYFTTNSKMFGVILVYNKSVGFIPLGELLFCTRLPCLCGWECFRSISDRTFFFFCSIFSPKFLPPPSMPIPSRLETLLPGGRKFCKIYNYKKKGPYRIYPLAIEFWWLFSYLCWAEVAAERLYTAVSCFFYWNFWQT